MSIPKLSVSNPVLSNLLMVIITALGVYAWFTLPRDLIPEIVTYTARISTFYPGASAETVEKLVTAQIEDAIEKVDQIDLITSKSSEGRSDISVQFEEISDRDFDKRVQDLRNAVDRIKDLPNELLDQPEVVAVDISNGVPMVTVAVSGNLDESQMKLAAEVLEKQITKIDGVSNIQVAGVRDREIWVEVDPDRLKSYNLVAEQVSLALSQRNLNLPAGVLEVGESEFLVRTMGEFRSVAEIAETIIKVTAYGTPVRVKDVASVRDTYQDARTLSRINGQSSISLTIQKKNDGNAIRIIDQIRKIVAPYTEGQTNRANLIIQKTSPKLIPIELPPETKISLVNDSSVLLRERLGILQNNALLGLVLVVVFLWLFMGSRNAFFAALGIPVAILGALWILKLMGSSINASTLFGLILVIGIVVDDAIVVIENVFRRIEEGLPPTKAAIVGAQEVAWPVLSASLTTMAAFLPLILMSGIPGQFMRVVPITGVVVILASLVEVFAILPAHIAEWSKPNNDSNSDNRSNWFVSIQDRYVELLNRILDWRYVVVFGTVLGTFVFSILAFISLPKELFPGEDFPQFYIKVDMPTDYGIEETTRFMEKLEGVVTSLPREEYVALVTNIGLQTPTNGLEGTSISSNVAEVLVELVPKDERNRSRDEIIEFLRLQMTEITGAEKIYFDKQEGGPPRGKDVEVKVKGDRIPQLVAIANQLKEKLNSIDGVFDVKDDFKSGKPEIRLRTKGEKLRQFGLTIFQVANNVRHAIEGNICTVYRDADEAIDVVVKYGKNSMNTVDALSQMMIATPSGISVPLKDIAQLSREESLVDIKRFDVERSITVSASVDREVTTPAIATQALQTAFENIGFRYPGYSLDFRGEFDQILESFKELGLKLLPMGVMLMYFILGAQFKSFLQPFIILFAIPFGVIGAMVGLLITQSTLSLIALFGVVALAGIVVNDSIVLIDFINQRRNHKSSTNDQEEVDGAVDDLRDAVLKGSRLRLRPIVLTSLTTIAGLIPMFLGLGGKSPIWQPLASTIIFGLLFSTMLTLFVMPALYYIIEGIRSKGQPHYTD
ncbi:MAG: efflux RND transporter permease subunit [Candidatus Poribacteria bacterium]|nr:efflux RND transporter permease subunit [Candidatus Poribacteria bacterium]